MFPSIISIFITIARITFKYVNISRNIITFRTSHDILLKRYCFNNIADQLLMNGDTILQYPFITILKF